MALETYHNIMSPSFYFTGLAARLLGIFSSAGLGQLNGIARRRRGFVALSVCEL